MYGERKRTVKVLVGISEGTETLERRGRIILRWIFRKCEGEWTRLIWLRIRRAGELL